MEHLFQQSLSLFTFVLAWISATLTTGSSVKSRLFCWFILPFIHTMASLRCLSTRVTSSSSKWLYCSSYRRKNVHRLSDPGQVNTTTREWSKSYLGLKRLHHLHEKLDLSSQLLEGPRPLHRLVVPFHNRLADFLQSRATTRFSRGQKSCLQRSCDRQWL